MPDNNAGSTCTLAVGALAEGSGNQTATFAVTVANPRPTGLVQISNTASIADDGANGTDPTPGNNSGSDTTLVVGLDYYTIVPPCRLLDTRTGGGSPITATVETEVDTTGLCSIPADAVALALNVTVIDPSNAGHIELYPIAGASRCPRFRKQIQSVPRRSAKDRVVEDAPCLASRRGMLLQPGSQSVQVLFLISRVVDPRRAMQPEVDQP